MTFGVSFRICKENDNTSYVPDDTIDRYHQGALYVRSIYKIKPVFIEDTKDILSEHRPHLRG